MSIHSPAIDRMTTLAWEARKAGDSSRAAAFEECITIEISCTIQPGSEACS